MRRTGDGDGGVESEIGASSKSGRRIGFLSGPGVCRKFMSGGRTDVPGRCDCRGAGRSGNCR